MNHVDDASWAVLARHAAQAVAQQSQRQQVPLVVWRGLYDSVHQTLCERIEAPGLSQYFTASLRGH